MDIKNTTDNDDDVTSAFTEKKWGREEEGKDGADGFSFRGKKSFEKVITIKESFVKGFRCDMNDLELRILDRRKKGVELEIEIEYNIRKTNISFCW